MQNIIAFCTEIGQHFAYTDYLTHIYNRNAFERDLKKLDENSDGYYIIADLNNLKVVNDTVGHSAGDELLSSFAGLLNEAVPHNACCPIMRHVPCGNWKILTLVSIASQAPDILPQSNLQ